MSSTVTTLIVGTGGYATIYLEEILHTEQGKRVDLVGAVDPYAKSSPFFAELQQRGIPVYDTLEEFYANHSAQVAIVSTPIHLHAQHSCYCMEHGSDVLCEKPLCASPADAKAMIAARDRTGRKLAVGFQWSCSEAILALKQDILQGRYGKIRKAKTIVYFPRNMAYYRRGSGWAGKRKTPEGDWLLDSVASNATAHYLHNLLFLTGESIDRAAKVESFTAEVYRANPIEMFDTCAMRLYTDAGTELCYYATHAVPMNALHLPEFVLEGEKGTATLSFHDGDFHLVGEWSDGTVKEYGSPEKNLMRKLYCMLDAAEQDAPLSCVPETAVPHLECIWALAHLFEKTPEFAAEYRAFDEENEQNYCVCLVEDLQRCWNEGKLPGELGMPWAQPAKTWYREDVQA